MAFGVGRRGEYNERRFRAEPGRKSGDAMADVMAKEERYCVGGFALMGIILSIGTLGVSRYTLLISLL